MPKKGAVTYLTESVLSLEIQLTQNDDISLLFWVPMTNISKSSKMLHKQRFIPAEKMIQIIGEKTAAEKAQSVIHAFARVDQTRDAISVRQMLLRP